MWIGVIGAVVLLLICVGVLYWLLKSMGEDGVEAAAPGSCRSGRCGVKPNNKTGGRDDFGASGTPAASKQASLSSIPLGSVSWASTDPLPFNSLKVHSLKVNTLKVNTLNDDSLTDEITRKDALSPKQTL
jgi:hypothetical protein